MICKKKKKYVAYIVWLSKFILHSLSHDLEDYNLQFHYYSSRMESLFCRRGRRGRRRRLPLNGPAAA